MIDNLNSLLLDLTGLDDNAAEALMLQTYKDIYLTRAYSGTLNAHDGDPVYFNRAVAESHAFHKDVDGRKDAIDRRRIERVKWIKEFISGNVLYSECWLIPERGLMKRVYCSLGACYIIWLDPRDEDGWRFSTAYFASSGAIRKVLQRKGSKLVCKFPLTASAPIALARPS